MQRTCLVLAACLAVALAGNLNPVTTLPEETGGEYREQVTRVPNGPAGPQSDWVVGVIDTVGGTTVDWAANGPIWQMIACSPDVGVHVAWMFSASNQTTFPDRNMRYNFYVFSTNSWNWIDPDFMQSGVNVFTDRCGYGNLSTDPATDVATLTRHYGSGTLQPGFGRDLAPGAGIFEYCAGPSGYLWPPHAVGINSTYHVAVMDDPGRQNNWYTRSTTWCNWDSPTQWATPTFPTYMIAASRESDKVCMTWVVDQASGADPGYYRVSTDGGTSWGAITQLPYPAAYGGDSITSFHITGLYPFYDMHDRLHVVGATMPYVAGTGYVIPADIWHWCPDNSPVWVRVRRATCNPLNLAAAVGYNALYACRPSMAQDRFGGLYVTWEEFDSSNVEVGPPERLRADIFYSYDNGSNGTAWGAAVKLTDRDATTKRFPSAINWFPADTLYVTYLVDSRAGFFVQGEGPATNSPVVVHKVPVSPVGVKEERPVPLAAELDCGANPFGGRARLAYSLPQSCRVELSVFDRSGRQVAQLAGGRQDAGRYSATWDAAGLEPGVYVARLRAGDELVTAKLVLAE